MSGRPAAFLDRDGTIIRDAAYVRDPKDVELLPGAADAVKLLNERGVPVIVVTNQSGIARGYLGHDDYELVRRRLDELLVAKGARIDATYMCPHYPDITVPCERQEARARAVSTSNRGQESRSGTFAFHRRPLARRGTGTRPRRNGNSARRRLDAHRRSRARAERIRDDGVIALGGGRSISRDASRHGRAALDSAP